MIYRRKNPSNGYSPIGSPYQAKDKVREKLVECIENMKSIEFMYKDHLRKVEPHACGQFSTGNIILVGYQTGGGSQSGKTPEWRTYKVNDISSLREGNANFRQARSGYNPHDKRLKITYAKI